MVTTQIELEQLDFEQILIFLEDLNSSTFNYKGHIISLYKLRLHEISVISENALILNYSEKEINCFYRWCCRDLDGKPYYSRAFSIKGGESFSLYFVDSADCLTSVITFLEKLILGK